MIAQTVSEATQDGRTIRVVFDPSIIDWDNDFFLMITPFENHAEFVGLPLCWGTDEAAELRAQVDLIETQFIDGTPLGTITAQNLHALCTG